MVFLGFLYQDETGEIKIFEEVQNSDSIKINSKGVVKMNNKDDFQKGLEAAKRFEAQQKINNALGTAHKGNFYVTPGSSDIPGQDRLNAALKNVKR
ncbi:MAG: hypothetical protein ACRCYA_00265 [Cetobacterium sp.]|uniref:hypothetical protein n=1 Tax=Cetobacterium sp. TaxID=2071632 RepID=UPI003F3AB72D